MICCELNDVYDNLSAKFNMTHPNASAYFSPNTKTNKVAYSNVLHCKNHN